MGKNKGKGKEENTDKTMDKQREENTDKTMDKQREKNTDKTMDKHTNKNITKHIKPKSPTHLKYTSSKYTTIYILSVVSILCIILLSFLLLKFYFLSGFDLSIKANPYQKSLYLYHNQQENVVFTLSKPNNFICNTKCDFYIFDSEKNQIIMNSSAKTKDGFSFNYSFHAPSKGKGQKIYNVNFKCSNLFSLICPTNEKSIYATSLVILNYDLSPEEKNSSAIAKQQLEEDIALFSEFDLANQKNNIIFNYLNDKINFNSYSNEEGSNIYSSNTNNNLNYVQINGSLTQLVGLWDIEDYALINEQTPSLHESLLTYSAEENSFDLQMNGLLLKHNIFAKVLIDKNENILDFSKVVLSNLNNILLRDEFYISYVNINKLNHIFNSLNFTSYDALTDELHILNPQIEFSQLISLDEQYSLINSGSEKINTEYSMLCAVKGYCPAKKVLPEYVFYSELNQIKNNTQSSDKICLDITLLSKVQKSADMDFAYAYYTLHYPLETTYENQTINKTNVVAFLYAELDMEDYLNNQEFLKLINILKADEYAKLQNKEINRQNNLSYIYNQKINEFNSVDIYNYTSIDSSVNLSIDSSMASSIVDSSINSSINLSINSSINIDSKYCYKLIDYFNSLNNSQSQDNFYRREFILNHVFEYCSGINKTIYNTTIHNNNYILSQFELQENVADDNYIHININRSDELSNLSLDFIKLAIISNNTIPTHNYFENKCLLKYPEDMQENYSLVSQSIYSLKNSNISAVIVPDVLINNILSRVNLSLKEHKPMCCVFGVCKVCCNETSCSNDSLSYSVIFVHGHAANKAQSPHYSLNVFDKLQNILQNEGYLNAGMILPDDSYSEVSKGEWGKSGLPIEVKFTYYLDVYDENGTIIDIVKNSEYIENYSVRLNRAIELLKYRTGKNKVNIFAHSMGGLVAREYIREFGDDSVNKIVMFGTPNYGIIGQTERLCPVLGETKECVQITQGSDFLNRLNAHDFENTENTPVTTKYYTIIGTGCDTSGFDGDGIVPAKNVNLSYSKNYYVKGVCDDWFNPLHGQMLEQIDGRYNQTYEYIKEILID